MKLAPAQLNKHLQGALAPVYVVSGDDPLLCQEAADAIRNAARQQGFDERQVFSADANFDWGTLLQAGASLSLFAQRRLLELRLPSGKPGDKGAAALMEYCANPAEDTLLLISLPKLDSSAQKTKWGKALIEGAHCQFIQIWPVDVHQLPQWINQRLQQAGLSAQRDAVDLIAARVEGNLLAAAQEIENSSYWPKAARSPWKPCRLPSPTALASMSSAWSMPFSTARLRMPCACSKACAVKVWSRQSSSGPWPVSCANWRG